MSITLPDRSDRAQWPPLVVAFQCIRYGTRFATYSCRVIQRIRHDFQHVPLVAQVMLTRFTTASPRTTARRTMRRNSIVALVLATPFPILAAQRGVPPNPDIFLVPLSVNAGTVRAGAPANVTRREGYDNQPSFAADARSVFFTSNRGDGQSDIYRYELSTGLALPVHKTLPESEYSAYPTRDGKALTVIRVEADSVQRLWRMPIGAESPTVMFPDIKPVGYFAQADDSTWALFVLGAPATLQIAHVGRAGGETVARNIGRSLHRIPGTARVSFVQKGASTWYVMALDPNSKRIDTLTATLPGSEDVAWVDSTTLVAGQGSKLFVWRRGDAEWKQIADYGYANITSISRLAVSATTAPSTMWLAIVADVKPRAAIAQRATYVDRIDPKVVMREIEVLAADSMEGRATGSRGQDRAAKWLVAQYKAAGLTPVGDSGTFYQHIPLQVQQPTVIPGAQTNPTPRGRPRPVASWAAWDSLPVEQRMRTANIAGMIRGTDPTLRDEVVLVTAHYDHIGIGRAVDGDSINNGADDDASGNIALIEMAKALRAGPRPKRTILFIAITGEEVGGFGTSWYIKHPLLPLEKTVVDLNVEMIAHPDSIAGGFGKAWLTGYERSTMGDLLADNGIPLTPDMRIGQRFFERSDNVAFARIGIPAHTISSYNLVTPYHNPKDEASTVDPQHMAQVISATAKALRLLADGLKPEWHPGGRPEAPAARTPR